jgi:dTDP-4-amino-4,6-dideoxygalactose transaminase
MTPPVSDPSPAPVPFLDLGRLHADLREPFDLAWKTVLGHGKYVNGPEVAAFEAAFAQYCEADRCTGVANGTDALELILVGLGIGPGDEVIVPTNTFVATAEAVVTAGAVPRFVDVLPDTLLIDPAAVEAAITPRTAAVMAVHLYGQMADMTTLSAIATRHGLALVEDAAQAHGARFAGRRAGSWGTAAGFSFYPGKNLGALGDGGAVVSNDAALVDRIRRIADHGRSAHDRYVHEVAGRNSRLDTLQAALLHAKLGVLDAGNRARRAAVARYREVLPEWCTPVGLHPDAEAVFHLAVVQVPDRAATTAALDAAGIGWGIHYPVPCHLQPPYASYEVNEVGGRSGAMPVAEAAAGRILSLPLSPTMGFEQVERVGSVLQRAER